MKSEKSYTGWYFLVFILILYAIAWVLNPSISSSGFNFSISIFEKIIPVLILVFVLLVITNHFISPEKIQNVPSNSNVWRIGKIYHYAVHMLSFMIKRIR